MILRKLFLQRNSKAWGRGGGQVVTVLAFNYNDPSSNPPKVNKFSVKLSLKQTKMNKKRPVLAHRKKLRAFMF